MNTLIAFITIAAMGLQDSPQDIAKKDLPKEAECAVCSMGGEGHGPEKPAAGVAYKGKSYYFCSAKEVAVFKKDPEAYVAPIIPRPMPEFSLKDNSGFLWNSESMKGKLVMVDFWATWCGPCKAMFPILDKLYSKYKGQGFVMLSVSVDEKRGDFDKFVKGHKFPNPVLHDNSGHYAKWGVRSIPATFLVKDGQVVAQWTGKQSEKTLEDSISGNLSD